MRAARIPLIGLLWFTATAVCALEEPVKDGRWYVEQITGNARNNPAYAVSLVDQALAYFQQNPDHKRPTIYLSKRHYRQKREIVTLGSSLC